MFSGRGEPDFKALKNCTDLIFKVSIISLDLLISYSLLIQLCIYSHRIRLSGDIELSSGPKQDSNQCFSVCHGKFEQLPIT